MYKYIPTGTEYKSSHNPDLIGVTRISDRVSALFILHEVSEK